MAANALNAIAFQLGWFACVLGGNGWALTAGALALVLHWRFIARGAREWGFIGAAALLGLATDLLWQHLGLIAFREAGVGGIPPWLAVLWLLFASTLPHSLGWLRARLPLAALLGALLGPLSYVAGLGLGAASTPFATWQVALAMAPAWMLLLPLLLRLARPPVPGSRSDASP